MNVAVCISGLAREGHIECIDHLRYVFSDYDVYFGHWKEHDPPKIDNLFLFDEPKINYHCITETKYKPDCSKLQEHLVPLDQMQARIRGLQEKYSHSFKQILAHEFLINQIDPKYDLIIKLRYDVLLPKTKLMKKIFENLINFVYQKDIVIGIAQPKTLKLSEKLFMHKDFDCNSCTGYRVFDQIIIHQRYRAKGAYKLYQEKNLLGSEWGCHQVFCQQWGLPKSYQNIRGGMLLYRYYKEKNEVQ